MFDKNKRYVGNSNFRLSWHWNENTANIWAHVCAISSFIRSVRTEQVVQFHFPQRKYIVSNKMKPKNPINGRMCVTRSPRLYLLIWLCWCVLGKRKTNRFSLLSYITNYEYSIISFVRRHGIVKTPDSNIKRFTISQWAIGQWGSFVDCTDTYSITVALILGSFSTIYLSDKFGRKVMNVSSFCR